jgi:hypothetical protein
MDSVDLIDEFFAENYEDSRQKFLQVCANKNIEVQSYKNDVENSRAEELACDVIRLGRDDATKLLVITSGVHGAELMCGSGCQVGMIQQECFASLQTDTAVVMIHAINPWGAANLRRNNGDNVDLCRNFVDFNNKNPHNPGYKAIHAALCCPEHEGPLRDEANKFLADYRQVNGIADFVGAIMSGQFEFSNGMSYGGNGPTWSHSTLMQILKQQGKAAKKVCLLDYHSGLGPFAYGSVVSMHSDEALTRARKWFGHWLTAPMEDMKESGEKFHPAIGHTTEGHLRALPGADVTSVVLEYGTYDMRENLRALLDDHWLALHGDESTELGQQIKKHMLRTHYPDDPEWRYAVWTRSEQVIRQAMTGLTND